MIIPIVSTPAFPNPAVFLRVNDGHVQLNHGANWQYQLLDSGHNPVSQAMRNDLTLDQYNGWTGDDSYVAQCVAVNVGLTPVNPDPS